MMASLHDECVELDKLERDILRILARLRSTASASPLSIDVGDIAWQLIALSMSNEARLSKLVRTVIEEARHAATDLRLYACLCSHLAEMFVMNARQRRHHRHSPPSIVTFRHLLVARCRKEVRALVKQCFIFDTIYDASTTTTTTTSVQFDELDTLVASKRADSSQRLDFHIALASALYDVAVLDKSDLESLIKSVVELGSSELSVRYVRAMQLLSSDGSDQAAIEWASPFVLLPRSASAISNVSEMSSPYDALTDESEDNDMNELQQQKQPGRSYLTRAP